MSFFSGSTKWLHKSVLSLFGEKILNMLRNFNIVWLFHNSSLCSGRKNLLWKKFSFLKKHQQSSWVKACLGRYSDETKKTFKFRARSQSQFEVNIPEYLCAYEVENLIVHKMMYQKAFKESRGRNSSTSQFSESTRSGGGSGCDRRVAILISSFAFVIVIAIVTAVLVFTKK